MHTTVLMLTCLIIAGPPARQPQRTKQMKRAAPVQVPRPAKQDRSWSFRQIGNRLIANPVFIGDPPCAALVEWTTPGKPKSAVGRIGERTKRGLEWTLTEHTYTIVVARQEDFETCEEALGRTITVMRTPPPAQPTGAAETYPEPPLDDEADSAILKPDWQNAPRNKPLLEVGVPDWSAPDVRK